MDWDFVAVFEAVILVLVEMVALIVTKIDHPALKHHSLPTCSFSPHSTFRKNYMFCIEEFNKTNYTPVGHQATK
jgi:hypothetical protein